MEIKTHNSRDYAQLGPERPVLLSPALRRARGHFKYFWVDLDSDVFMRAVCSHYSVFLNSAFSLSATNILSKD